MLLLVLFAFIAGAGTGVTPCVLPILPALLSASATGGRRRPVAIVLGLTLTFTLTVIGVASVIDQLGLGDSFLRNFAIVVLAVFGVSLIIPHLGDLIERPLAGLSRFGPRTAGDGFWSGLAVGGALGVVCAPCAGPILGAIISVSATRGASGQITVIAIAFALGLALTLGLIATGGRRLVSLIRAAGRGLVLQRALGAAMVVMAIALSQQYDVRVTTALASNLPGFLTDPTGGLQGSTAVQSQLGKLRGKAKYDSAHPTAAQQVAGQAVAIPGVQTPPLPVLGTAPEFTGNQRWFNTPGGKPLTLASRRGKVVLVDFWTYTCINCIRTFPFLRKLDATYRRDGLVIVGVHSPEFSFEHDAGNVAAAINQNQLRYPVVQDNQLATWNAYGNQYWPADYLIDAAGNVRHVHFGEGDYPQTEAAVRALLAQAGARRLSAPAHAAGDPVGTTQGTPETYLGNSRAERFLPAAPAAGTHLYNAYPGELPTSHFSYTGRWRIDRESATALQGAALDANIQAQKVFLVLSPARHGPSTVEVLLDGKPVTPGTAGADARRGIVTVTQQRLYRLLDLPRSEQHHLTLRFSPGVSGFAFTFG